LCRRQRRGQPLHGRRQLLGGHFHELALQLRHRNQLAGAQRILRQARALQRHGDLARERLQQVPALGLCQPALILRRLALHAQHPHDPAGRLQRQIEP